MSLFDNNAICDLLNIQYPVIEGGMAWAGSPELCIAVSEAGALGTIGAGAMNCKELKEAIEKVKTQTNKPFAVNFIVFSPSIDEQVEIAIKSEVPICIFGAGNPERHIQHLKENGVKVLSVCSSPNLAILLERAGVDGVIGEGLESGGHVGDVSTMALIPAIRDCTTIPLIAAGGIFDGRSMAAALALGADGVQMGTRFLCSTESTISDSYKNMIIKKDVRGTHLTGEKLGHPVRVLKTSFTKKVRRLEEENPKKAEEMILGSLKNAVLEGDIKNSSFMAGMSAGNIHEVLSVNKILETIIQEYKQTIRSLNN
ncbi:MAG: enoyl-[acyl-carrier protein] reductase [Thermotogaceae bacterium]|jgi:enoyl-[acyl-carrier protein] reductase II|nr:enoyl-[acyl-carrier protein] reductase [Thermotogaceae bacterium]